MDSLVRRLRFFIARVLQSYNVSRISVYGLSGRNRRSSDHEKLQRDFNGLKSMHIDQSRELVQRRYKGASSIFAKFDILIVGQIRRENSVPTAPAASPAVPTAAAALHRGFRPTAAHIATPTLLRRRCRYAVTDSQTDMRPLQLGRTQNYHQTHRCSADT